MVASVSDIAVCPQKNKELRCQKNIINLEKNRINHYENPKNS